LMKHFIHARDGIINYCYSMKYKVFVQALCK